jgi:hypothetical protein
MVRTLTGLTAGVGACAMVTRFAVAPLDRFDEGVTVLKGMLVSAGKVPFRDFWTSYGPLDSYLLGGLFHVLGQEVLVERMLAALIALTFTALGWRLNGLLGVRGPMRVVMTGLLALVPVSIPALAPTVLADLIGLAAFGCFFLFLDHPQRRWPIACGVLTGVAAFTRPEFAAVLGCGLLVGFAIMGRRPEGGRGAIPSFLGAGVGTAALLWVPTVLAAGLPAIFFDVVVHTLTIFPAGRRIPLGQGADGPAVVVFTLCFGGVWLWAITTAVRARGARRELAKLASLTVSAMLAFDWVLTRADAPHAIGAWPLTAVLLALLMARRLERRRPTPAAGAITLVAVGIFSTAMIALAARDLARPADSTVAIPHAVIVGSRAWMPTPQLAALLQAIDAAAPPGQPIFVGVQRNDMVVFNDAMLYFLAGRAPGTTYDEFIPALTTVDSVQAAITCQLARSGTTLAVLGPNATGEPWNASSMPGSQILDRWLRAHTTLTEDLSPYVLLRLRLTPSDRDCRG